MQRYYVLDFTVFSNILYDVLLITVFNTKFFLSKQQPTDILTNLRMSCSTRDINVCSANGCLDNNVCLCFDGCAGTNRDNKDNVVINYIYVCVVIFTLHIT